MPYKATGRPPGRPRKNPPQPPRDDDDDDALEQDEAPAPQEPERRLAHAPPGDGDEIEELLDSLGANLDAARIIVHRVEPNKDPEECCDCPLTAFSKEQLRAEFGAGEYHCQVKTRGTIRRRWSWKFAKPAAKPEAATSTRDARADELERQLSLERQAAAQRSHELVLALIQRPQAPAAPGLTVADLAGFKDLFGGGDSKQSTLGAVREVLEVADMLGSGGGGGGKRTGWADLALEGLKQLPGILEAGRGESRALPAPTTAPTAPTAAPAPAAPAAARAAAPAGGSARDQVVALLLEHAGKQSSPTLVGQFIFARLQDLPDAEYDTACTFLESSGALGMALMFEPRLKPARPWLEQVLGEIRAHISAAQDEPDLTGGAGSGDAAGGIDS